MSQDSLPLPLYSAFLFPHFPSFLYKKRGIQNPRRLFWDVSLPYSQAASLPNKVTFFPSTSHLWFTGLLFTGWSKPGFSNKFDLLLVFSQLHYGILGQGSSSCWDHLCWQSLLQDSLKWHQWPQGLAVEANFKNKKSTNFYTSTDSIS